MATLSRQSVTESGLAPTYSSAAGGGDDFVNRGKEFIHVKNGSGSSITVTVTAQNTDADNNVFGSLTKSDASGAVAAGDDAFFGPFPPAAFNSSGKASITYSSATSVTVAVLTI